MSFISRDIIRGSMFKEGNEIYNVSDSHLR